MLEGEILSQVNDGLLTTETAGRCVCDDSCCGEWGKRAYLVERSVFDLPESPTQRYRSRIYSTIYLPADAAVAREVAGSAER